MDKPYYPHKPIGSIDMLAKALGVRLQLLTDISQKIDSSYSSFEITSKSGKKRVVYEPKFELKKIQKRINSRIFELVQYPIYLQGGIKDPAQKRDYVENAWAHADSKVIIGLDIKDFYNNIRAKHVKNIFKYLLKFPDDVVELITSLVTLDGRVPQGACTSSYIANLILFNSEYRLVSNYRNRGITYTRLLDDVTLSSKDYMDDADRGACIKEVAGLFRKYDLRIKKEKTHTYIKNNHADPYDVTGLWVGHAFPKLRKKERRYIRQLVFECEKEFSHDPTAESYHELWNKASGQVAKMQRLGHAQSKQLRMRLRMILPRYSAEMADKVQLDVRKLLKRKPKLYYKKGDLDRINRTYYALGVLSRSKKDVSRKLRKSMRDHYKNLPSKQDYWL